MVAIKGLEGWLSLNANYLSTKERISNCKLVVDANLLCTNLTSMNEFDPKNNFPQNDEYYGCNLVLFGEKIRNLFNILNKCNIQTLLVFQGSSYSSQELKDFRLAEARQIFSLSKSFDVYKQAPSDKLLLLKNLNKTIKIQVFKGIILKEYSKNVLIYQALSETDPLILKLINKFNCYTVANESTILSKSLLILVNDFINLSLTKLDTIEDELHINVYKTNLILNQFSNLNASSLPLVSILLADDYLGKQSAIQHMLNAEIFNKLYHHKVLTITKGNENERKILSLLNWLNDKSTKDAIYEIQSHMSSLKASEELQIDTNELIEMLSNWDKADNEAIISFQLLYPQNKAQDPSLYLNSIILTSNSNPTLLMDLIFNNKHIVYQTIENFDSSYSCSDIQWRPISVALALLKTHKDQYQDDQHCNDEDELIEGEILLTAYQKSKFVRYCRVGEHYKKSIVDCCENLQTFGSLKNICLYSLIDLNFKSRFLILADTFLFTKQKFDSTNYEISQVFRMPTINQKQDSDKINLLQSDTTILMLLIDFAACETENPSTSVNFKLCLLLTLYNCFLRLISSLDSKEQDEDYDRGRKICERIDLMEKEAHKSSSYPRHNIHKISELHSSIEGFNLINAILGMPLSMLNLSLYLNGPLINSLLQFVSLKENKKTVIELCSSSKSFSKLSRYLVPKFFK